MSTKIFKCTLQTDLIINQKAATEGNQQTLDFIPGSNFLGIVAGVLYEKLKPEESLYIFHSGKIKFGDAHPGYLHDNGKWQRTLRIPASMFYPKTQKASEVCYIHHVYDRAIDKEKLQMKQCREGFYAFEDKQGFPVNISKSFAIKSAYDRDYRRSADEQMYGYQSLDAGSIWFFEVSSEEDKWLEEISKALIEGEKRVGRSKTAQYGLVKIEEYKNPSTIPSDKEENETQEINPSELSDNSSFVLLYADARLIFLDEYGLPTFRPKPTDLGFEEEDEIIWEKSQLRTFQYAPWNFTRQARDTDRCGIEKGSVIYIKLHAGSSYSGTGSKFVGKYQNEGFGKVLINPDFLLSKKDSNGISLFKIKEKGNSNHTVTTDKTLEILTNESDTNYLNVYTYLKQQKEKEAMITKVYELVNSFVIGPGKDFKDEKFASQWGNIRNLAIQNDEINTRHNKIKEYLTKGIAKDKWEGNRYRSLERFLNKIKEKELDDNFARQAIINLANEMAKEK